MANIAATMRIANMKICTLMAVALATASFCASPAMAQSSAATYGNYADVSAIHVLPGQWENYMDYLKANWIKQSEWGKSKGYVVSYRVMAVTYPREGEPNLILVTEYKGIPTQAEQTRRQEEFAAYMKLDDHQHDEAALKRGPMRTLGSQNQYQEVLFK
jgi:hypothetical protein